MKGSIVTKHRCKSLVTTALSLQSPLFLAHRRNFFADYSKVKTRAVIKSRQRNDKNVTDDTKVRQRSYFPKSGLNCLFEIDDDESFDIFLEAVYFFIRFGEV